MWGAEAGKDAHRASAVVASGLDFQCALCMHTCKHARIDSESNNLSTRPDPGLVDLRLLYRLAGSTTTQAGILRVAAWNVNAMGGNKS